MAGPTAPDPAPKRVLLGGCVVVGLALGILVALVAWLVSELESDGAASDPPAPTHDPRPSDARDSPTRTERRQLRAELREVERDLEFARDQARMALDPTSRASWEQRTSELENRRREIERTLDR